MDLWDQALEAWRADFSGVQGGAGAPPAAAGLYMGTIPVTAKLPWDHIDIALEPDFLLKEYRKALKDRLSPPCAKPYKKLLHPASVEEAEAGKKDKLICYDCGVSCDLTAMKEERLYYLRRMNAWTKPVDPPPVERREARRPDAEQGKQSRQAPVREAQGPAYRYRLRYTKLGRVSYLGHLDLVRHLPRIFRRARVELLYSVGFHPKPELSFGPALGLGVPSLGELVDVKLADPIAPAELVERLNAVSLDGIRWLGGVALGDPEGDRALGKVLARSELWAMLPRGTLAQPGLALWQSGEPLRVLRKGEGAGVGRMIDLRQSLRALSVVVPGSAEDASVRAHLLWNEPEDVESPLVAFQLAISTDGSAKPGEVIAGLWGEAAAADVACARVALWAADGERLIDPLDTGALRQAPRSLTELAGDVAGLAGAPALVAGGPAPQSL